MAKSLTARFRKFRDGKKEDGNGMLDMDVKAVDTAVKLIGPIDDRHAYLWDYFERTDTGGKEQ